MSIETATAGRGHEALQRLLPPGWTCGRVADLRLIIRAPDGAEAELVVAAKRRVPPGSIPKVAAAFAGITPAAPFVVAGWLSPLSRAKLSEEGLGYLDLTGNVDLRLSRPGLYLHTQGAQRDPEPLPSTLGSLKGTGGARAVRALADFIPPYGVRQLAALSGASAPVLSRVLALLDREGVVDRDPRGTVSAVAWTDVLRRWVEDYSFVEAHRAVPCLDPRGLPAFSRKLVTWPGRWAATGTMGVPRGVEVVPLHLAAIYVDVPEQAAGALGLKRVEAGANIVLVEPADEGVFARSTRGEDGVRRCAPSQVFADLLTGPGRGSAEAEALLGWMQENEGAWRTQP